MVEEGSRSHLEVEVAEMLQVLHGRRKNALRSDLEFVQEKFPEVVTDAKRLLTAAEEDRIDYAHGQGALFVLLGEERVEEGTYKPIEKNRSLYQELRDRYLSGARPISNPLTRILETTFLTMVELEKLEESAIEKLS